MRPFVATAAVLAVAAVAPAAAVADESLQASGSITYTWQGSPSLGCASVGVCDVQGALIVDAQGSADVQRLGPHQSVISLNNGSATVRVLTGTGQNANECVDTTSNLVGPSVFVSHSGSGLVGTIQPSPSSGRCAGPLASDLRGLTLPVRESAGKHPSYDLRTSRAFTAGPFAGTVVSTVTMRPVSGLGFGSSSSSGVTRVTTSRARKALVEHVSLRYRVTGGAEPLTVSFSGQSDPFCAVLDSCGASGQVSLSAPDFAGTLTLQGSRQVPRHADARQVLADVKHGRLQLFGELTSQLETSETFTPADGSRCQDSAAILGALLVGGFPPSGSNNAVLAESGPDVDALRTHCPGPSYDDVFGSGGERPLARGPIDLAHLLAPRSTLTVSAQGGFSGLGYAGSRSGAIAFSLSLVRVRAGTSEETR